MTQVTSRVIVSANLITQILPTEVWTLNIHARLNKPVTIFFSFLDATAEFDIDI